MRFGTMTSHFRDQRESNDFIGYVESIDRCVRAGFKILDMNLCGMLQNKTELNGDDWHKKLEIICKEQRRFGIEFVQSHPPYRPFHGLHFPTSEEDDNYNMLLKRSIEICAALGVKWAVLHPVTVTSGLEMDTDANLAINHEAYDNIVELADKKGVGIAFENVVDVHASHRRRFGVTADEMIQLVDSFGSAKTGVCWDTGHGNRVYADQIPAIMKVGRRIKATHINDNKGMDDLHLMPFLGTVNWEGVMKAFRDFGYEGDFIYEISFNSKMPGVLKDMSAAYNFEVSQYLLSLAE